MTKIHFADVGDELEYYMSSESEESAVIQSKVMMIVHLKAFLNQKIE